MTIVFVIHEATRTGAPRLGGLVARELARAEEVRLIVMKDGPLTPWLEEQLGARHVSVCRGDPFYYRVPFEERLRHADDLLARERGDIVYVNSLAASIFALAAALQKRKSIVHVHEKTADMVNLLAHDVTKLETMRVADAAVLAADDIADDLEQVFHACPREIENFGVAVDIEAIGQAAALPAPAPLNAAGAAMTRGSRLVVGMSGHASARKGVDIFLETAAKTPQHDFLWVGGWTPEETPDNVAFERFVKRRPPNLYIAGSVENPYPYMRMMDLFFLSSREDPNPLVIAEALVLGLPLLCFSRTTAIADRLGRCGLLCHGEVNAADAARVLAACDAEALRSPSFRGGGEAFIANYDLKAKMPGVRNLIARLRGEAPPADAPRGVSRQGARRELGEGVVELTFS